MSYPTIQHCPINGTGSRRTIMKICRELETCNNSAALTITPQTVGLFSVDDVITVTGGIGPYEWAFDKGTIVAQDADPPLVSNGPIVICPEDNQFGKTAIITAIDACGASGSNRAGKITVTDSCGSSTSIAYPLPGFLNIKIYDEAVPRFSCPGIGDLCDIPTCKNSLNVTTGFIRYLPNGNIARSAWEQVQVDDDVSVCDCNFDFKLEKSCTDGSVLCLYIDGVNQGPGTGGDLTSLGNSTSDTCDPLLGGGDVKVKTRQTNYNISEPQCP